MVVALHATKGSKLHKAAVKTQVVAAGGAFAASVTDKVARASIEMHFWGGGSWLAVSKRMFLSR